MDIKRHPKDRGFGYKKAIEFIKKYEYKTCDKCCYDILDDEGNIMEHECITYSQNLKLITENLDMKEDSNKKRLTLICRDILNNKILRINLFAKLIS